jgi:hypothetical protein
MDFRDIEQQLQSQKDSFKPSRENSHLSKMVMERLQTSNPQVNSRSSSLSLGTKVAAILILSFGIGFFYFKPSNPSPSNIQPTIKSDIVLDEIQKLKQDFGGLYEINDLLLASYDTISSE